LEVLDRAGIDPDEYSDGVNICRKSLQIIASERLQILDRPTAQEQLPLDLVPFF
jgi:hypothetical protein